MLTIKCSRCKSKLIKYRKIGKGKVLRCHKSKIKNWYDLYEDAGYYYCSCGNIIGENKEKYIKMNRREFTYSGTKE